MASSDNKKPLPERRVSRNSVRMSTHGGEEEDYDLMASAISDGFRPMQPVVSESTTPSTSTTSVSMPSASSGESDATSSQPAAKNRPSSIAKPPRPHHDSFSLRHDGGMGQIREAGATRTLSMSTDSTTHYIRNEGPYQGPSGPSHPYQMYSQNVRTRTMSVATTSTVPVTETAYTGPRGPTHPYGMYPQGTAPEANTEMAVAAAIPVGFNGVGTQYQRRIGPEGEELADMIGPDGHTEQLPPYTRYPEESYARKVRDVEQESGAPATGAAVVGVATAAAAIGTASSQQGIAGAGGLGLATRNPEFESTDDLGSPQSRYSTRSFPTSSGSSHHEMQVVGASSEKGKPLKPWQLWMKRRLWGIVPYWAICLTLVVMVLMAIILGSVVGTLLSKHKKPPGPKADADTVLTTTITYDATPIPTPTDLAPLATGTWSFPLMSNRVSSTCFNDTQQSQAWNCNLIMSGLYLTVTKNTDFSTPGDYAVTINCNESLTMANNVYSYGEQPPTIRNPLALELVNDTFEPSRGPAWFRMMPYNKTVILPENTLTYTGSNQKRGFSPNPFSMGPGEFKRKNVAQVGDKPWICTWPDTFLELFIYPNQNSSWNRNPVTTSSGSVSSTTGSSSATSATATVTSSFGKNGMAALTTSTSNPSGSVTSSVGDLAASGAPQPPPPPYPRVIKLEERRVDGSPEATCIQVEVTDANKAPVPVKDSSGNVISITIAESEPPPPGTVITANLVSDGEEKRAIHYRDAGADISQCGCMWFLT